jgi:C_GCAxxG_C_C family probable redox protein
LSFKEHYGWEDSFPKLAAGFGGGIARRGSVCGAISGCVMMIGMKFGRTRPEDKESIGRVYKKCREFLAEFEREFGSSICYNLTGCDFDNPPELKQWLNRGGNKKCADLVGRSVRILWKILEEK